jgi:hypothetical protein
LHKPPAPVCNPRESPEPTRLRVPFRGLCDRLDSGAREDDATLRACEFELTDEFRRAMKLARQNRSKNSARRPVVMMSQLVLREPLCLRGGR